MKKTDILADIREVAQNYPGKLTRNVYLKEGKFTYEYAEHGSWKSLLAEALTGTSIDDKIEVHRLEEEIKSLKRENKSLLDTAVSSSKLLSQYREYLTSRSHPTVCNRIKKNSSDKTGILICSDWHVGERVRAEAVHGLNEYNKNIFVQRADHVLAKFVGYCKKIGITEIHLWFLGDLISGFIHDESSFDFDLDPVQSMFYCQDYITEKLNWLAKQFNRIDITIVVGNHGRVGKKPTYKRKVELNYEYVLARQLRMYFDHVQGRKRKIHINVPESPFEIINVNGTNFLIEHGEMMSRASNSFAGIPFYGLSMVAVKKIFLSKKINEVRHIIIGHLHNSAKIPITNGGYLWINSSLIGLNEFSIGRNYTDNRISQLMLVVDRAGEIDGEMILQC